MAALPKNKSFMPGSSWEAIKRVIRAYHAVADEENPSGGTVAKLAGLPRPVVSTNNNFLRILGILQPDQFKLTETGARFALGMAMNNGAMVREALQQAAQQAEPIRELLNILRARGSMNMQAFKGEIMLRLGLNHKSWQLPYIKTLLDFLEESQLIAIKDDTVSLIVGLRVKVEGNLAMSDSVNQPQGEAKQPVIVQHGDRLPLPLGPSRLAYIELPPDWDRKELRKLIKLLEISLGDDEEVVKS